MRTIRTRLTYSNVVSTLALFLVLCGGAAYAAKVGKKSVGPSQLKANAVTTAKIKANAVTTRKIKKNAVANAKIKDGAIESEKIADGSITGTDINTATTPFSRIVFEARGNSTLALEEKFQVYPLANPTYTQEAGRDDMFTGAFDASFKPTCNAPREVLVYVIADSAKPTEPTDPNERVAIGQIFDVTGVVVGSRRVTLNPVGGIFQSATATQHTLSMVMKDHCSGGTGGATVTFGAIDVIGTKK